MSVPLPPKVVRLADAKQKDLDDLLSKNAEGTISAEERASLERLVVEAENLMVANARQLADYSRSQAAPPLHAVPVTVWIAPQPAE
jgi:hypothetical protein